MIEVIPFLTRARTIDHLGREQVADCPTAVSELWKNAYDAYARNVALHIFDGEIPIAAMMDDGHGMSYNEFKEKWLVIGTESKATESQTPIEDRDGLPYRPKQGQKGIGRLSCANLGSLLFLVSKRRDQDFVAALIDWRIFENPFLLLQDIMLPVVSFSEKQELLNHLPALFDNLMGNVWENKDGSARALRIAEAWERFDKLEKVQTGGSIVTTRQKIELAITYTEFTERHMALWSVWTGDKPSGTLLLLSDISDDLIAQLKNDKENSLEFQARVKFRKTLTSFIDPFLDDIGGIPEEGSHQGIDKIDFSCSVTSWNGQMRREVISKDNALDFAKIEILEHIVIGDVDEAGSFRGRVKAFGKWLEGKVDIAPPSTVPTRASSRVGSFRVVLATYERDKKNSIHTAETFQRIESWAEDYAGFFVFRDNLRVMPYGREDNDFFEIEKRRSKHAGSAFWNLRNMFGKISFSRENNPNLKDKSSREGLIDNTAAKYFKDLIINILEATAKRFFGSGSDFRKDHLPIIQEDNQKARRAEDMKKLRLKRRKDFHRDLDKYSDDLKRLGDSLSKIECNFSDIEAISDLDLYTFKTALSEIYDQSKVVLGEPPKLFGTLEEKYRAFRATQRKIKAFYDEKMPLINEALEKRSPKNPKEIISTVLKSNASQIQVKIRRWTIKAKEILESEVKRIDDISSVRNKAYHSAMSPLVDDVAHERISLSKALSQMDTEKEIQNQENSQIFEPYIGALESLHESIDLEGLASFGQDQISELRQEIERLTGLAQLGITVEIIDHELGSIDATMTRGIHDLPEDIKSTDAFHAIKDSYESLIGRLRFLSPLKLSGEPPRKWLYGREIFQYVVNFFGDWFERNKTHFHCTLAFEKFKVYERPSRLFPVFINLVNNARYWVCQTTNECREILLDAQENLVIIADNGPGVEDDDLKYLFSLFFTKKIRGGRGVGLYLCRTNLAAGGHKISYVTDKKKKKLPGANFLIEFAEV